MGWGRFGGLVMWPLGREVRQKLERATELEDGRGSGKVGLVNLPDRLLAPEDGISSAVSSLCYQRSVGTVWQVTECLFVACLRVCHAPTRGCWLSKMTVHDAVPAAVKVRDEICDEGSSRAFLECLMQVAGGPW